MEEVERVRKNGKNGKNLDLFSYSEQSLWVSSEGLVQARGLDRDLSLRGLGQQVER